jgi:hypothetical protein
MTCYTDIKREKNLILKEQCVLILFMSISFKVMKGSRTYTLPNHEHALSCQEINSSIVTRPQSILVTISQRQLEFLFFR